MANGWEDLRAIHLYIGWPLIPLLFDIPTIRKWHKGRWGITKYGAIWGESAFYSYEVLASRISYGKLNFVDLPPLSGAAGGRWCCWGLREYFFYDANAFFSVCSPWKSEVDDSKHFKIYDTTWIGGCMPLFTRILMKIMKAIFKMMT